MPQDLWHNKGRKRILKMKERFRHGYDNVPKILAAHAGLDHVEAGQLIEASLDLVLGNDVTAPVAINEFEKCGAKGSVQPR